MRWNSVARLALGLLGPIAGVLASDATDTLMDGGELNPAASLGFTANHYPRIRLRSVGLSAKP